MRERLHEAELTTRYHDRERQSLVTQLSEQNSRLTAELQAASRREEELQVRLSELRGQVNDKRLSMQDHILYLENLKEEVTFGNYLALITHNTATNVFICNKGLSENLIASNYGHFRCHLFPKEKMN